MAAYIRLTCEKESGFQEKHIAFYREQLGVFCRIRCGKESELQEFKGVENKLWTSLLNFQYSGKDEIRWMMNVELDYQLIYFNKEFSPTWGERVRIFSDVNRSPLWLCVQTPLIGMVWIPLCVTLSQARGSSCHSQLKNIRSLENWCAVEKDSGCTIWKRAEFEFKYRRKKSVLSSGDLSNMTLSFADFARVESKIHGNFREFKACVIAISYLLEKVAGPNR